MLRVHRDPANPLIAPVAEDAWRAEAAFNPSVIERGGEVHLYFRALQKPSQVIAPFHTGSTIGCAISRDGGKTFDTPIEALRPEQDWEAFGMEDPRATVIDDITYLSYTALGGFPYGPNNIKAALAISRDGADFSGRHLLTPFNAKAFALFPHKVNGEFCALLTAHTDYTPEHPYPTIAIVRTPRIEDLWDVGFWESWHLKLSEHALPDLRRTDEDHIEVGASPVWTEDGWLLVYSYISHYRDEAKRSFGIEALLLDHDDPRKVLGRTLPFMVPEAPYEKEGMIPNIVFPSSARIAGNQLEVYYGGADTVCARATISLPALLDSLTGRNPAFVRARENPILKPIPEHPFESRLVFNPAAIELNDSVYVLYRAMGEDNTSEVGLARIKDGIRIDERLPVAVYGPRHDYELKRSLPNGNSGCEDPRAVVIDDHVLLTYTAYNGIEPPCCAMASISVDNFLAHKFDRWSEPKLMTPPGIDDKDCGFLPAKVDGKYVLYHRTEGRIVADVLPDLSFSTYATHPQVVLEGRPGMWDGVKVGIACPPLPLPDGTWLLFYHGVSARSEYRIGAARLDASGLNVIARLADPVFEPVEEYEKHGEIPNVVFPCGAVVRDDTIYLYYGGADTVVGVATGSLSAIVTALS
jgi:predicted GH43/DUF377 family glycosyl hydrolase